MAAGNPQGLVPCSCVVVPSSTPNVWASITPTSANAATTTVFSYFSDNAACGSSPKADGAAWKLTRHFSKTLGSWKSTWSLRLLNTLPASTPMYFVVGGSILTRWRLGRYRRCGLPVWSSGSTATPGRPADPFDSGCAKRVLRQVMW